METLVYSAKYVVNSTLGFHFRHISDHIPIYEEKWPLIGSLGLWELWLSVKHTRGGVSTVSSVAGEVLGHEGFPLIDLIEDRWGSHVTSKWPKWEENTLVEFRGKMEGTWLTHNPPHQPPN